MEWLTIVVMFIIVLGIIQIIRLALADSDLTLAWKEKYGIQPAVLRGKVVWLTGCSSGIGEFLAYELAAVGCKLVLTARRQDELYRVKKDCIVRGHVTEDDLLVLPMDLLDFHTFTDATNKVLKHFGKIDILVNNAGRSQRAWTYETEIEVDRMAWEINALAPIALTKAVLPHMRERKQGHIVATSSVAGKIGVPYSASYNSAKHALQGWFDSLRLEVAEDQITVSCLCPGPVRTDNTMAAFTGRPGQVLGEHMAASEKRMTSQRCAELMTVAIANQLEEAWITIHPPLIFLYVLQYMPSIGKWFAKKLGSNVLKRLRNAKT